MRLRRLLTGIAALLVLLGIIVGLPAVLIAVGGNPLPVTVPDLSQVRDALLSPDDGTLALTGVLLLGWVVWAALAASVLVELAGQLRGVRAPQLPGLSLPQSAVRGLVTAALALFIAAPAAVPAYATTATAQPEPTSVSQVLADTGQVTHSSDAQEDHEPSAPASQATSTYVVQPGDTLWSIAQDRLGSGRDYHRIVELNTEQLTAGADWVRPGQELLLPAETDQAGPEDGPRSEVLVQEGDTLSGIAAAHLGDGARWPEIYEATVGIVQPGGHQLTDPDLIYPGWRVHLPAGTTTRAPAATPDKSPATDDTDNVADVADAEAGQPAPAVGTDQETEEEAARAAGAGAALGAAALSRSPGIAGTDGANLDQASPEVSSTTEVQEEESPSWLLAGIAGSGAMLGGSLFLALALRSRSRFRQRRPGRAVAPNDPVLAPVEKTIQTQGAAAAVDVEFLDEVLRRLGTRHRGAEAEVPAVVAVELADAGVRLHLAEGADLPWPWEGSDDRLHWFLPATADLDEVGELGEDSPAPFPLLVAIGAGDDGSVWLLNLEDLEVCLTGAPEYVEDLARFLAAEVAVNPWSAGVRMDCTGVAAEVIPMNPARLREAGPQDLEDAVADVVGVIDRAQGTDVPTARVRQMGEDTWRARVVLLAAEDQDALPAAGRLRDLIVGHGGRSGAAIVIRGGPPSSDAMEMVVTSDGRLRLPAAGLDLVGVGLTADEAAGCAALIAQSGVDDLDVAVPAATDRDVDQTWRAWSNRAGSIREEHTTTRESSAGDPRVTILPEDDEAYLEAAATTQADLNRLSPALRPAVAEKVLSIDPTLDEDLAAWWQAEARVPKLSLLGPVKAKTWGKPMVKRKAYFTELLAYLALHPGGVTTGEVAAAFNITEDKARDYIGRCREWLGRDADDDLHLPHAQDAPATQARGTNVYQVLGLLVDVDLFRRLRTRAEARGGPEGMADLRHALRLVEGQPFDQLRRGGWGWLFEGERLDQHMLCAVVDVAHLVATHDLQAGDLPGARAAAEIACLAAPHEEIPTLDLAAVTSREGHHTEAVRLLQSDVCNRTDDPDSVPGDLPERTQEILDRHGWLDQNRQEAV